MSTKKPTLNQLDTTVKEYIDNAGFDGDYNSLINKPSIPTKVSELNNDSNFETTTGSQTKADKAETDANTYTDGKATELDGKIGVLSELNTAEKASLVGAINEVNSKETNSFSGDYVDLINKPTIPSKTSQLTNDNGFITTSSIPSASTTQKGIVQLNSSYNSTDTTMAATPSAVRTAYVTADNARNLADLNNSKLTSPNVAIGTGAVTSGSENGIAIGKDAVSGTSNSIVIGYSASATGSGDRCVALGSFASTTGAKSIAIGYGVDSPNAYTGVLGDSGSAGVRNWNIPGNLSVSGTKNFEIPHPHPDKKATHVIRHGAVESPTTGDTLYRYTVEATSDNQTVELKLPDYFEHLNTNVDVWVNGYEHFGRAYGKVSGDKLLVTCEKAGIYKALIIGTRNDDNVQDWHIKGVEREIGESWNGETYVFEVDELTEVTEFEEVLQ